MIKKSYLLFLALFCINVSGFSQITIVKQSFEASGDTWTPLTFSTAPCNAGNGDQWDYDASLSSITPNDGSQFWGIQDLNGSCGGTSYETITFPSYSVSSYTSVTISFDYYTIGFDSGDDLGYEIWEDGVKVVDLVNLNDNTGAWTTITHNVTAATSNVYLVLKAIQDGASGYGAFDNVLLTVAKTEWDGSNWTSTPASNKIAAISANYDTANSTNGQTSFEACNLIVETGATLMISDGTYVEVQNDLTVDGAILLTPKGAFVQINNGVVNGDILLAGNRDKITVEKETAPLNNWYEYTYWSSPVSGEAIADGLFEASPIRRYWFDADAYKDEYVEINNDNATVAGQDDIDDDGNDWQSAVGFTMQSGIGYAATHNPSTFIGPGSPPYQFKYTFEGPFNNGPYSVTVSRNDSETSDNNWNFIGNPYPSAIDADLFLTANTAEIDGAIFLWSQNTAPSGTTNDNENLNFSQADYAIINGIGETAGGDTVTPSRFIPSGQGFFVSYSDSATPDSVSGDIKSGTVSFTNSMRVRGTTNNNQFFRTSNLDQHNKIWLDLTSDNGVFNQIMVGYINGATNAYDGMYYDTPRNLSTDAFSILYSKIDSSNKKYAIQAKNPSSLDLNEIIPLGFYTSIEEATLYTLSISNLEGDFLNNNTIYVKDNLLNIIHDLTQSSYTFTSETGEFNNRFEIVFTLDTLSIIENEITSDNVTIIEFNNGDVKFTVSNNLVIKSVEIIDKLGRTLYKLKGNNSSEIYKLSNLSQAAYIAKIELSNGQLITKRAIKRH